MKKAVLIIIIILCILLLGVSAYHILKVANERNAEQEVYDELDQIIDIANHESKPSHTPIPITEPEETPSATINPNYIYQDTGVFSPAAWQSLKKINSDFQGYLIFDKEYIKEPVVQGKDNKYYLNKNIYKEYHNRGTVFMSYQNTLDDMNLILYGHNNKYYRVKFAGLNDFYYDAELYKENAYFNFFLENEVRRYVICYVFMHKDGGEFNHQTTNFTEEEFNEYLKYIEENNVVPSIDTLQYGDNFMTLQTCKRGNRTYRLVAIAKEVGRWSY